VLKRVDARLEASCEGAMVSGSIGWPVLVERGAESYIDRRGRARLTLGAMMGREDSKDRPIVTFQGDVARSMC
jgi:hypothetical protein